MIFSSPFSPSSLSIPKPNQHKSSSPPSPLQSNRSLPISSSPRAKMASSALPSCSSLYDVLGIPMAATTKEIKAAYRKLARVCHPDVAATKDAPPDDFIKIHTAYSTLSDPHKRADYDHRILRRLTNPPLYSSRKWETDQCW